MDYIKFKQNKTNKLENIKVICVVIVTLLMFTSISGAFYVKNEKKLSDGILSYSFTFNKPKIQTIQTDDFSEYSTLQMSGCIAIGRQGGYPSLPVKSVKLLLPAMKTVSRITVSGIPVELASLEKPLIPYQNEIPIGFETNNFQFNSTIYNSNEIYPSDPYENYNIGYCRGYTIMDITFCPVQYIASENMLFYYPKLTVNINLEDNVYENKYLRDNQDDKSWVEQLVYNPEIADTYTPSSLKSEYSGGLCSPSNSYDYVIITTTTHNLDYWPIEDTIPYNWESLMNRHKQDDGLICTLVTIQDIDTCSDYYNPDPLFNDTEAHIREFCKDAYMDWGTQYVFIGGDDELIPARHMKYAYEANVDSDLYWSNLDNTFNDDHDFFWGEEEDLGFDLYSELFIGRITCDEPQDVSNWMTKSFYYADSTDTDYLENAAFYGGRLGWGAQGDDFIDYGAIKGTDNWLGPVPGAHGDYPAWLGFQFGFETLNSLYPGNEFNLSVKWTAELPNPGGWQGGSPYTAVQGLKNAINNDQVTLISAIAHANASMSMDVYMDNWESEYHNTKPFFIYDMGCHCGDPDARPDGVLHSMLFHSDTELAFACVYNTCFGWGSLEDTNSSSALLMKLFWDYLFDMVNNSGSVMNWQLGKAMAFSKDAMAPTVNWTYDSAPGSWRGVLQGCLLFGDPAQRIKSMIKPPVKPELPSGPTDGEIGIEYTFISRSSDPEDEQVYYLWNWGDGTFSEWMGPFDSDFYVTMNHTWNEIGDYNVTVKAKDIHNAESSWSDPLTIHIISIPHLEIQNISGGIFKIKTVIKNNGSMDAKRVNWDIQINGGLVLLGKESSGTILNIPSGEAVTVESDFIFGIGRVIVVATAEISDTSDTKEQDAFILLSYIKIYN